MASPTFDIWDQAVLTDLINKPIVTQFEDQPFLGQEIAPQKSIQARHAKVRVYQAKAFGIGQFKAPDATPPLVKFDQTFREEVIELALLEEMERISGEDWLNLNSTDENIRKGAGVELVDRGRMLQLRNERLSEWMRWQAFVNGNLTIPYDDGNTNLFVDYGYASTHKVTLGTLWSDTTNSDPIANMKTWGDVIADDSGYYGLIFHMSSKAWDYLIRNDKIKALLTGSDRALTVPTSGDVTALLRDGSVIKIYDNGYRNEGATGRTRTTLTRYLPEDKVLVTTNYNIEGENIADTLDGQVLVNSSYNSIAIKQGSQSEVILDPLSKNQFFRVASARIPRILHPECFLVATVL
jgi:hypothetical protein